MKIRQFIILCILIIFYIFFDLSLKMSLSDKLEGVDNTIQKIRVQYNHPTAYGGI